MLTACGGQAPPAAPPAASSSASSAPAATSAGATTAASSAASSAPKAVAGKVLVLASGQDVSNLDPHTGYDYAIRAIQRNVYDALLKYEGNPPQVVPWLAEKYEASPDAKTFTFYLRKDAKFHDGSPVTAEAVKFSFDRMLRNKKGIAWMYTGVMDQNSVAVVDPTTVKITLTKPYAPFLSVVPWLWIANPKLVKDNEKSGDDGQAWLKDHEAGSGPFKIKRWEPGTLYELERDPAYWNKDKGAGTLSGAIWKVVRESASARQQIQKGEVNIATDLGPEDMDLLKGQPKVKLIEEPEFRTFSIKMNMENGPTKDINVRRAISYAFDYKAMLEAEGGHAKLMRGPLPPGLPFVDEKLKVPEQGMVKAKEFLAKSQYPNGGFELEYTFVQGLEVERKFGLILLDNLKQLNIKLNVKQLVWPDMVARAAKPDTSPSLFPVYLTANFADPDNFLSSSYSSAQAGTWSNPGFYKSAKLDELIEKGKTTVDKDQRAKIYQQAQELIVEDAPELFGVLENRKLALSDNVEGYKFTPLASNSIDFFPLSLK